LKIFIVILSGAKNLTNSLDLARFFAFASLRLRMTLFIFLAALLTHRRALSSRVLVLPKLLRLLPVHGQGVRINHNAILVARRRHGDFLIQHVSEHMLGLSFPRIAMSA
jgi:hypothetical protein